MIDSSTSKEVPAVDSSSCSSCSATLTFKSLMNNEAIKNIPHAAMEIQKPFRNFWNWFSNSGDPLGCFSRGPKIVDNMALAMETPTWPDVWKIPETTPCKCSGVSDIMAFKYTMK